MSILAELDASLEALRALKAPGVTKSRIAGITALCVENVKSESVLVQKIYTQFKRTPATHKLGVLYVVDSVTRQWIERAGATRQDIAKASWPDGTFAAGVRRVTELLPVLMNDLIQSAPDDQKDKISKLLDIWERGNVFPSSMLADFHAKLRARAATVVLAAPTAEPIAPLPVPQAVPQLPVPIYQGLSAGPNTRSADPRTVPAAFPSIPPVSLPTFSTGNLNGYSTSQSAQAPPNLAQFGQGLAQPSLPLPPAQPAFTAQDANALASVIPAHIASNPEALNQHLRLLQQLAEMGVPADQWALVIKALHEQHALTQTPVAPVPLPASIPIPIHTGTIQRPRSRSPAPRRDSPVYGKYDSAPGYRQRSPIRSGSASLQDDKIMLSSPKWTDFDGSLPEGNIKVLSRTLFAGGVACSEDELRKIFTRFGQVQTCIVNQEKRHAFVKMCTRAEAIAAKAGMENVHDPNITTKIRSTRWGVGFGPRDCSDYQTGVSIIPIDRLTEADRKWTLSAPFGGTGGKPIVSGIVMEEPDIEIGAGVSSKAISARRPEGRRSNGGNGGNGGGRGNDSSPQSRFNRRAEPQHADSQPRQGLPLGQTQSMGFDFGAAGMNQMMQGYGFQMPGMPGMPGVNGMQRGA